MAEHDIVSWNSLIIAQVHHGLGSSVLHIFNELQQQSCLPTSATFVCIFNSCSSDWASAEIGHMVVRVANSTQSDVVVSTAVISMYGNLGWFDGAWRTFVLMDDRNVTSWNAIITACVQCEKMEHACKVYQKMLNEGMLPNKTTFLGIISACGQPDSLFLGKFVHACIASADFYCDLNVVNALIHMYNKCGRLQCACQIFDGLSAKNRVSWTTLIAAQVEHGESKHAFRSLNQMMIEGILWDKVTLVSILEACISLSSLIRGRQVHAALVGMGMTSDFGIASALVNMYGKCGNVENAWKVFDRMSDKNVVPWTSIIGAHAQQGCGEKALCILRQMVQEGIVPNKITFLALLNACAVESALFEGKRLHAIILSPKHNSDMMLNTSLIDMYGKCGQLKESLHIFEQSFVKDVVLCTAMMAVLAHNGRPKDALLLFDKMQHVGIKPDDVSFVFALSICSHSGMVEEGRKCFATMGAYGITPSVHHYNCMIDLLGRAGCLDEAEDLIHKMSMPPTALQWLTLLNACRSQLDVERAERAARHVFMLDPKNPVTYVVLSNIYTASGRKVDAESILSKMRQNIE